MDGDLVGIIIVWVIASSFVFLIFYTRFSSRKEEEQAKEIERERRRKEQEEKRIQEENDFANLLEQRVKEYGCLTKRISISTFSGKENDIFVYEESKTIFIMGKKYMFNDILSCNIEKQLYAKGRTTHITTPDKGEMATQEFLYGMGKKYNVKTTTTVVSSPDTYKYIVYSELQKAKGKKKEN